MVDTEEGATVHPGTSTRIEEEGATKQPEGTTGVAARIEVITTTEVAILGAMTAEGLPTGIRTGKQVGMTVGATNVEGAIFSVAMAARAASRTGAAEG